MSLFCGDKCKCKRSCEADLGFSQTAIDACKAACKTDNPPTSGWAWLQGQPALLQDYYSFAAGGDVYDELGPAAPEQKSSLPLILGGIILIGILIYIYLKKK